ncbi:hypothetical protein WJX74_004885, partial [Apatococcus lobatus]
LHLLAVTADGRRVYLSASGYVPPAGNQAPRPNMLRAEVAQQAVQLPSASSASPPGSAPGSTRELVVAAACYSNQTLLVAGPAEAGRSRLLMASRDLTTPPLGTHIGLHVSVPGLRETLTELDMRIPGEACSVVALDAEGAFEAEAVGMRDELCTQHLRPPQRFIVASTAGVQEFEKRRPYDILQAILEEGSAEKLEQFFQAYGPAEVACMCLLLATSPASLVSTNVITQARAALENPRLTGEPVMRQGTAGSTGQESMPSPSAGFDMGQAVPVAEPEWSAAHRGLCLYLARILQPAWDEPIARQAAGPSQPPSCPLSKRSLQGWEEKLRSLDAFLGDHQQRMRGVRRTRPAPSGGFFMDPASRLAGRDACGPAAKRPRVEEAVKQEDQRVTQIRAITARAAQAMFLLHKLVEGNLGRLALRLDDSWRSRLLGLQLRSFICTPDGEAVAAQLISLLVTKHLNGSGGEAEKLAEELQKGCPAFFREDDRIFYRASGLLQQAESGQSTPAERADLAREALRLMMQVPLACDLGQVLPQLAYLRSFEGIVDLALKKAAALDPGDLASRPDGDSAREARWESCYQHVMVQLKYLLSPSSVDATAPAAQRVQHLASDDQQALRKVLLQRAMRAPDAYFHEVLYRTLLDMGAISDLLSMETPFLEGYLKKFGGLHDVSAPGGPLLPLNPSQVQHLRVLAKLYSARRRHERAAQVYELLATRHSGLGDSQVSLVLRVADYDNAIMQAKQHGDASTLDNMEVRRQLLAIQLRVLSALLHQSQTPQQPGESDEDRRALNEELIPALQEGPRGIAELYNDFCAKRHLWGFALEMVALAHYTDRPWIQDLWDVYLRQGWDAARSQGNEGQLEKCCLRAASLGEQIHPNPTAFPLPHVALRLEQVAAGAWPEPATPVDNLEKVANVLLKICGATTAGALQSVQSVYDNLLVRRGADEAGSALHAPLLRIRLLRALYFLMSRSLEGCSQVGSRGGLQRAQQEVGSIVNACERYALDAKRLHVQQEADETAAAFESLSSKASQLLTYY